MDVPQTITDIGQTTVLPDDFLQPDDGDQATGGGKPAILSVEDMRKKDEAWKKDHDQIHESSATFEDAPGDSRAAKRRKKKLKAKDLKKEVDMVREPFDHLRSFLYNVKNVPLK